MSQNNRYRPGCGTALFIFLVVALVVLEGITAVKPEWPEPGEGDPVPPRPQPDDPTFHRTPLAITFGERRALFLAWVSEHETPESRGGIWVDIAKLENDPSASPSEAALSNALEFVNAREDTADFVMAGLLRLYYKHAGSGRISSEQEAAMEQAFRNFKYWLDEPNPTLMELWTENHQILAHSAEYLAGQLFPGETFSNNSKSGRWHMEAARERILRWIDWHARTGMAEWDSVIYYRMDIAALLNLVDFSQDEELSRKAAMMVDLLLFDMTVDSYYGQYATSYGRTTAASIKSAAGQSMLTLQALVWGLGRFQSIGEMASISMATGQRYQLPAVIEAIGQHVPEELVNRERHSILVSDGAAARYNLSFERIEDIPVWWGMGAFTHPKVIDLTIRTADEWQLWHYPDFRPLEDLAGVLQRLGLLSEASALLDPDPNGVVTSEVNKLTYRTPDYSLSSAQDYRKGGKGYQQHIWGATLSPYAVVFTTNPDSLRQDDKHRPSYWASNGRLPRTAQHRSLLIALYNIDRHPSPSILEARHYAFTHAYFPKWAFDQIVEVPSEAGGGWVFGKVEDGYVALYSYQPYAWQDEGPDAEQEIIALGRQNVWICQMGRRAVDGSFEDFIAAVSSAPLDVDGLRVDYQAPGIGALAFDWKRPLTVDGEEISLDGYPRWDNPYLQATFGDLQYTIAFEGMRLELDFANGVRRMGE